MKLLVTGGAGFIGSHLVRTVLADELPGLEGARVTVLDKLTYAGNFANLGPVAESKRLDFVPGDVGDAALVDAAARGADAIVHLAAETSLFAAPDFAASDFAAPNVLGTQVLLDAALRHETPRFLQVSTDEVYGSIDAGAWTERSPVAPDSPYAATKAAADLIALACHRTHGLPVMVSRSAGNYGPYQHPEKVVPRVVTSLLTGRTARLDGDGTRVRDWLHVDDHCRGLALVLTEGKAGETYHIGGDGELSDRDLAGRLLELCGADRDRVVAEDDREGRRFRSALDDDKIRSELGYRPRTDLGEGLAATVRWYRDHEEWWRPLVG